jgi:predicted outer membrane repeat protein
MFMRTYSYVSRRACSCSFQHNEATDDGGAVYVAGKLVLKGDGNRFEGNRAGHLQEGVYIDPALGGRVVRAFLGRILKREISGGWKWRLKRSLLF